MRGRRRCWRVLFHRDAGLRQAMRWYTQMGRRVWPHEILGFPARQVADEWADRAGVLGPPQDHGRGIDVIRAAWSAPRRCVARRVSRYHTSSSKTAPGGATIFRFKVTIGQPDRAS